MKNKILLIMLILAGAIVGAIAAKGAANVDMLQWLAYSKDIGLESTTLDLIVMKLTFGFELSLSVAQIIFMIIATFIYPKIAKLIA